MKNIILGVTGSVAAYKAAYIASILTKRGYNVDVIMTKSAMEFVTPLTFQSLTKNKVYWNMFEEITPKEIKHISLAKKADLCLIAPASANVIGKIATGIADDMLTTVVMAMNQVPIFICPAMNTNMYNNPIVQRNIRTLSELGYRFIDPKEAVLACGDLGKGALADVETIVNSVETYFK
ncbi:Phosphopantothenoylcysteine decarboxylase [Ruminiclostridium papyrosolvens DSM 2782]|uniref:Phosphopantothenoylcysteine decarboxylase n=1 Tax=Ruminiclostridium papyrosolvens DSM 2782 TaxID=588581 RepID=F1TBF7_9FIRM|nr:bifunctional phosphopantothenoylcysteine decarboxylase/phosphopantothenate--cysteine ligase CoaBC [Ruminiclostridium papyrosolvens]EGD48361.1 Phosphopantothenoylcysteine decarboxylase [Ruminiclostridium papyrosolvens DSM 2782]WES34134.1 bifunctional phosphopantothenoylcysteine decarboxylase/phosphopantothenate--cysteine ligase CoaBC [Ruminiclostridium papyrosolvens DSM 2782]